MINSSLKVFQAQHTPRLLKTLEDFFDQELQNADQKDQVLVDIVQVLKEFTLRGGKRVRPLLTLLAYFLARQFSDQKDDPEGDIYKAAAAVEIHHHYLLNLDDMADRDVLRHGGKTVEEYYKTEVFHDWPDSDHHGRTLSSISGALLNSFTFKLLNQSGFSAQRIIRAQEKITDMLFADTVTGWQIQYLQNHQPIEQATVEQFMKGLEYVTSRYTFVGPMQIGLALAGVRDAQAFDKLSTKCAQYGKHVGIAFQLKDDIMGTFGDPDVMGKAVGNDLREGKKTLLVQYAYEHGDPEQQMIIKQALNHALTEDELAKVQAVILDTGSLAYSQELARSEAQLGIQALEGLDERIEAVQVLKELAIYVVNREK